MRIGLLQCDHALDRYRSIAGTSKSVRGIHHPEFPAAYARALYEDRRERLGDLVGPAIESLATATEADVVTDWMYAMFAFPTVTDS